MKKKTGVRSGILVSDFLPEQSSTDAGNFDTPSVSSKDVSEIRVDKKDKLDERGDFGRGSRKDG